MPVIGRLFYEIGGDIGKFSEVAGLVKLNNYFGEMVQHFRDTGEILPDLRGATIYGYDEFARRVAEAQAQNARRSGVIAIA
jgi:hypothetical protein